MRSSVKSSMFAGFRFPREVISVAVRWYLRYGRAFVQNLRRGHYELAIAIPARHRIRHAFDQLTMTI
jgi:hypothetical protein